MSKEIFILLCAMSIFCACSKTSELEYLQKSQAMIKAEQQIEAEFTLKQAVKEYPTDTSLRIELGKLYLSQGIGVFAQKELEKSVELGATKKSFLEPLFESLKIQNKSEDIITLAESVTNPTNEQQVVINTYKGIAELSQGQKFKAQKLFTDAVKLDQEHVFAKLSQVFLFNHDAKYNDAINKIDEIVKQHPNFTSALIYKGQLLYELEQYDESAKTFEQYLSIRSKDYIAKIYYLQSLVKAKSYVKAEEVKNELITSFPNQPLINHLAAVIAFENKDYLSAKKYAETSLNYGANLNADTTILIAAVSSMHLENYEQAYSYLEGLVKDKPQNSPIHKIFAVAQYKLGLLDAAATTIGYLDIEEGDDLNIFTSIGLELINQGESIKAEKIVSKIENSEHNTPESLHKLGLLKLSLNDSTGVQDLIQSLELSPDQTHIKLMLATAYIKDNKFDDALALATEWRKTSPNDLAPINLQAYIYLKQGDISKAEEAYNESLRHTPSNYIAYLYFKAKLVQEQRYEEATQLLNKYITLQEQDLRPYIHLYAIKKITNEVPALLASMRDKYESKPNNALRLLLARIYNYEKMYAEAESILTTTKYDKTLPQVYWQTLATSLVNQKDAAGFKQALENWRNNHPEKYAPIFFEAVIAERQGRHEEAISILEKWNKTRNRGEISIAIAALQIKLTRYLDAEKSMLNLDENQLKSAKAQYVLGRIALKKNKLERSLDFLTKSYESEKNPEVATSLAKSISRMNGIQAAVDFLENHLKLFPEDIISKTMFADFLMEISPTRAIKEYSSLLELDSTNVVALNNSSIMLIKQGNYNEAESRLEKALKLSPNHPELLDTMGLIKSGLGKHSQALELHKVAYSINNKSPSISFNYAESAFHNQKIELAKSILSKIETDDEYMTIKIAKLKQNLL